MGAILVTGAATGIGREIARRAAARGERVFATMLPGEERPFDPSGTVSFLDLDVGVDASVDHAFLEIDRRLAGEPLDRVVNCAGIAPSGAIEVEPLSTLQVALNVNAVGSARILKQALPRLRASRGRILLFASLWGRVAGPMLSAYCASKHAVEAIADSARREIHGQGVDIVLIEPGVVRTNMVDSTVTGSRRGADTLPPGFQSLYADMYEKFAGMIARESSGGVSVEQAVDVIERALVATRPKTRYRIGKDAKAVIGLAALLPDRTFDVLFRTMLGRG